MRNQSCNFKGKKMLAVLAIIIFVIVIILYKLKSKKEANIAKVIKNNFSKYIVIEKFGTTMICEINHRNEPDELVFIRVDGKKKNIKKVGRRVHIQYAKTPSEYELKQDLKQIL